ncbi:MAG: hypothetical protein ACE365_05250 [Gammaproteobacteria bacterium]
MLENEIVLSVYFCGTAGNIKDESTYIGFFANITDALDVTEKLPDTITEDHYKMAFDGCGYVYGLSGTIFASGLEEQCQVVVDRVKYLLDQGKIINLNFLGLSRGGIAGIFLAQKLSEVASTRLKLNLVLFDPVPGNLIISQKLFFKQTVAGQAFDLEHSCNLQNILVIYPHEPLPDFQFHAPEFPDFPDYTRVNEIVVPGCHQGAFSGGAGSATSKLLVLRALRGFGTILFNMSNRVEANLVKRALREMDQALSDTNETKRCAHSRTGAEIVSQKGDGTVFDYLNPLHAQLAQEVGRTIYENPTFKYKIVRNVERKSFNAPEGSVDNNLLVSFIAQVKLGLSNASQASRKAQLLDIYINALNGSAELGEQELQNVLRDVLATVLQRERNAYSFYHTTTSGYAGLEALRDEQFSLLRQWVSPGAKKLRYRDLRQYVLSENNEAYFNSKNKDATYGAIASSLDDYSAGEDHYQALLNRQ